MNKKAKQAMKTTLWQPDFESDACGMGFIAQIDGKASHLLVERALTMLTRMNHRGGTGAEPETGDGAGILLALPDEFFRKIAKEHDVELPKLGDYAVGQFFLSRKENKKHQELEAIKQLLRLKDMKSYSRAQFLLILKHVEQRLKELCRLLFKFLLRKNHLKKLSAKFLILKMIYLLSDEILKNVLTKRNYIFVHYLVRRLFIRECFTRIK